MKKITISFFKSLVIASLSVTPLWALNPAEGWYGGLILGGNYPGKTSFTITGYPYFEGISGHISYGAGGLGGAQVGFRNDTVRVELEGLYQYHPQRTLRAADISLNGNNSWYFGQYCHFKGNTQSISGILNAYYDFYSQDTALVPYIGLGIGFGHHINRLKIFQQNCINPAAPSTTVPSCLALDFSSTHNAPLGQAIIGTQYFMDDMLALGVDYRLQTSSINIAPFSTGKSRFLNNTFNVTLNISFDTSNKTA